MEQSMMEHFGNWWAMVVWIVLYGVIVAFTPFYRKVERKPATAYLAFVVAFALEMFGIPFSAYVLSWIVGTSLPEGVLWGHTLFSRIGYTGMYLGIGLMIAGVALVVSGWSRIYRDYWRHNRGTGTLVQAGIYRYIRHPQYTGFLLVTLGMIFEWATLPTVLAWPWLVVLYVRLARREERGMIEEFGDRYRQYARRTGMFLPKPRLPVS